MAIDKFGNEVPVSPGYKHIVGNDGVPLKQEETLFLGPNISGTAVTGGTLLEAPGTPASSVTLGDMADLAAGSVIGNTTASPAAPTAVAVAAAGFAMLTALTVAAQTALLNVATQALKGLFSAVDKAKLDNLPVTIYNAALSGSSVHVTWAASTYRRIGFILQTYTGNAAAPVLTFDGFTNTFFGVSGYMVNGGATGAGSGTWTQGDQWITSDIAIAGAGTQSFVDAIIALGLDGMTMHWNGSGGGGVTRTLKGAGASGGGIDTLALSTGFTVTFGGDTTGWLQVIGYP